MIELLSMLGGGIFRLLPEVIGLFKRKQDNSHELQMMQLQLQIDQARAQQQLDMMHVQGEIAANTAEMAAMVEALKQQGRPSGVRWVDALSTSVRPILTYWWCVILYTAAKAVLITVAVQENTSLLSFADILFTDFDRSVTGSIIAFWFVDRALRKWR